MFKIVFWFLVLAAIAAGKRYRWNMRRIHYRVCDD